jgi:hypothetical protein
MTDTLRHVTANVAGWDVKRAGSGTKNVRVILTNAAALLQCLCAGGVNVCFAGLVSDRLGDTQHNVVQDLYPIPVTLSAALVREITN